MRAILLFILLVAAPLAWAQTPEEQAYLAARDRVAADLTAKSQMKKYIDMRKFGLADYLNVKFHAEYDRKRRRLEGRLRGIVGPVDLPGGFSRSGTLNKDFCCWGGVSGLDGLRFEASSGGWAIVTTEGLARRWLADNGELLRAEAKPPADVAEAVRSESFFLWGANAGTYLSLIAALPISVPPSAAVAFAWLAGEDRAMPDRIAVTLLKDERVYLALVRASPDEMTRAAQALADALAAR